MGNVYHPKSPVKLVVKIEFFSDHLFIAMAWPLKVLARKLETAGSRHRHIVHNMCNQIKVDPLIKENYI